MDQEGLYNPKNTMAHVESIQRSQSTMNIVNHQNVQRLKARPISAMETGELLTHFISNGTWQPRDNQQLNRQLSDESLLNHQHFLSEPRPQMAFQSHENHDVNQPIRNCLLKMIMI
ncbi:hypothetical protein DERF_008974 [Dermatophagoides farinae]|uniref:Uncharacterized protein n=1 Tax=Dermatophagoides farinae TaxID=6954 RepID=A0A922HT35_DERFA|nr:hypothetical protein DERF_008974 [Dermatophagoides farinae]